MDNKLEYQYCEKSEKNNKCNFTSFADFLTADQIKQIDNCLEEDHFCYE